MRNDGLYGRGSSWPGMFGHADDRITGWCMCTSYGMDFCVFPNRTVPYHWNSILCLSDYLDDYLYGTYCLFSGDKAEDEKSLGSVVFEFLRYRKFRFFGGIEYRFLLSIQ